MTLVPLSLWERGGGAKPHGEAAGGRGAARPRPKGRGLPSPCGAAPAEGGEVRSPCHIRMFCAHPIVTSGTGLTAARLPSRRAGRMGHLSPRPLARHRPPSRPPRKAACRPGQHNLQPPARRGPPRR
jgi:hypothetical protein